MSIRKVTAAQVIEEVTNMFGGNEIKVDIDSVCDKCGTKGKTQTGYCIGCTASNRRRSSAAIKFDSVPTEFDFFDNGTHVEYLISPELKQIADRLIGEYKEFYHLSEAKIGFFWKEIGGKSKGKLKLGECSLTKGIEFLAFKSDFTIWLAADNLSGKTEHFIEAVIYHELCHAGWDGENGKWKTIGHWFEGFPNEIKRYGLWKNDMQEMKEVFEKAEQPRLFR
jgi:Putative phage metallopeptidase